MVSNISQLVNQLFQKETLDEVSESELRYFIRQYPYAGTGHLLLTKKLQLDGEKRAFEREIAVTSIYFNNPAWLQFILTEPNGNGDGDLDQPHPPVHPSEIEKQIDPGDELEEEDTEVEDQDVQPAEEPVVVAPDELHHSDSANESNEHVSEATVPNGDGHMSIAGDHSGDEEFSETSDPNGNEHVSEASDNNGDEQPKKQLSGEVFYNEGDVLAEFITEEANEELRLNEETLNAPWEDDEEENKTDYRPEDDDIANDEKWRDNFERRKHLTYEVVAGDQERPDPVQSESGDTDSGQPGTGGQYEDTQMVDRPDLIVFEAQKASQRDPLPADHEYPAESGNQAETEPPAETQQQTERGNNAEKELHSAPGQPSATGQPLATGQFGAIVQPTAKTDDLSDVPKLEFDPYHTIDYFASQGIKLRLEDFSRDKLGQQLKSFTEWIRSMKKLPQQVAENSMDETDQHSIRRIAEHSVQEKEVLTESMAEVWIKQGNYEKARQIYRKLSLQNPSKSAYFAAKIDQLKV